MKSTQYLKFNGSVYQLVASRRVEAAFGFDQSDADRLSSELRRLLQLDRSREGWMNEVYDLFYEDLARADFYTNPNGKKEYEAKRDLERLLYEADVVTTHQEAFFKLVNAALEMEDLPVGQKPEETEVVLPYTEHEHQVRPFVVDTPDSAHESAKQLREELHRVHLLAHSILYNLKHSQFVLWPSHKLRDPHHKADQYREEAVTHLRLALERIPALAAALAKARTSVQALRSSTDHW